MNVLMEITTATLMQIVPIPLLLTNVIVTTDTEETEGYAKVGCVNIKGHISGHSIHIRVYSI